MKKKRRIYIKDPRLCRIRLNLRRILLMESDKRLMNTLGEEKAFLQSNLISNENEYFKQLQVFNDRKKNLRNSLSASIVVCAICRDIEGDRIFNPRDKIWYCPKCFEILEKSYKKKLEALGKVN